MNRIAVFDFDGTYTRSDTLPLFLQYAFGKRRYWREVLFCFPWLVLFKLGVLDGSSVKERLLGRFVKGMPSARFEQWGHDFAREYAGKVERASIKARFDRHQRDGDTIVVASASIRQWVEPFFEGTGATVLCTELEVDSENKLTGRFATPNCNGIEKVNRLRRAIPDIQTRSITAYGDSHGDQAMLAMADEAHYRPWDSGLTKPLRSARWMLPLALALLVAYQLLGVFWGMDVADAGFYLTFYDNIFTHPGSVEYNFMYYLSGLVGGSVQMLFPSMGMLGMRLVGVLCCVASSLLVYFMLRGHLPLASLIMGLSLVIVSFIAPPYTFSYDLCTVLLYCCAFFALFRSATAGGTPCLWAVWAGVFAGLNIFARIPNVLALAMCVCYFIHEQGKWHPRWGHALRLVACFLSGVVVACCAMVGVMNLFDGHARAFQDVIADLRAIASDRSGMASHSSGQLLMTQLRFYWSEVWVGLKLGVLVLAYCNVDKLTHRGWLCRVVRSGCVLLFVWMVSRMNPLSPLWLMCVVGCLWVIARFPGSALRLAAWLGLGMMLVMPCGSDGYYNNGSIIAWLAAPVACVWWIRDRRVVFPVVFMLVCAVRMVAGGAYFDGGPLWEKCATVHNSRSVGILTTQARADILNTLLEGLEPHVKPGTTLMAYGSIPSINYMTHTRPYVGCSWPEQLSAQMLRDRLASAEGDELPLILRQKFNTIGMFWGLPHEDYLYRYDHESVYCDNRKLEVLNQFMARHRYVIIYEDGHFALFQPQQDG